MIEVKRSARVSPSGGGLGWTGGIPPHYLKNWLAPTTVLTQKCQFCNFHAVFGHFAQTVPPTVDPDWETLSAIPLGLKPVYSKSDGEGGKGAELAHGIYIR